MPNSKSLKHKSLKHKSFKLEKETLKHLDPVELSQIHGGEANCSQPTDHTCAQVCAVY